MDGEDVPEVSRSELEPEEGTVDAEHDAEARRDSGGAGAGPRTDLEARERAQREAVLRRFAEIAERVAEQTEAQLPALRERVARFLLPLSGRERALDAGTGAGALALALSDLVAEVGACDVVPALLEQARRLAGDRHPNVSFVEGDLLALPFPAASFDLVGTLTTFHHLLHPERALAELVRVTKANGRLLIIDHLAPLDPMRALELDRFERVRDPSHARKLSDQDMRSLFDMNGLRLIRQQIVAEQRDVASFLADAGCSGTALERARSLAPGSSLVVETGWYLLERSL
jgi:ubiquinone/menaquinone biosynthesis C-methylase UbiE